jgi:hypothetical protein
VCFCFFSLEKSPFPAPTHARHLALARFTMPCSTGV